MLSACLIIFIVSPGILNTYFILVKEDHEFIIPKKAVTNQKDMPLWEKSEAYMVKYVFL